MFICLAAVLNMGNIKFGEDENEYSFVKDKTAALATVAVSADLNLVGTTITGNTCIIRN